MNQRPLTEPEKQAIRTMRELAESCANGQITQEEALRRIGELVAQDDAQKKKEGAR